MCSQIAEPIPIPRCVVEVRIDFTSPLFASISFNAPHPASSESTHADQTVISGERSSSIGSVKTASSGDVSSMSCLCSASSAAISDPLRSSSRILGNFGFYHINHCVQSDSILAEYGARHDEVGRQEAQPTDNIVIACQFFDKRQRLRFIEPQLTIDKLLPVSGWARPVTVRPNVVLYLERENAANSLAIFRNQIK